MVKVPKTRYPSKIESQYVRDMRRYINDWRAYVELYCKNHIYKYVKDGTNILTDADDDPMWDNILNQLDLMSFELRNLQPAYLFDKSTQKFVRALNTFSYHNVKTQVAIIGIDPISDNRELRDYVQAKIKENTNLITTMEDTYINRVKSDIYRELTTGCSVQDIANDITKRTGMAYSHANLIARDQTGTIISKLNSYRQQKAGVEKYIWRTSEDERVRPAHKALDGKTFKYGDPDGGDQGMTPGQPINCRCTADPIIDL